jgi:uncharacterized membrane protein YgcG
VYRRELERASRQLAERFELLRDGTFCESQRSLVLAYVTGVAGPNRKAEARRHLDSCPACASWVLELRAATRRAAAVVPAPVLVLPVHRWLARLASAGHGMRHRAATLVGGVREHGVRTLARADPSQVAGLGGARPGAVAAILTGCLAAGSTATYCAVQGLPAPLRSLIGSAPVAHHDHHRHGHRASAQSAVRGSTAATVTPTPVSAQTAPIVQPRMTHAAVLVHRRAPSRHSTGTATQTTPASGSSAATRAAAVRVQRQTNPEFGLGSENSTASAGSSSSSSGGSSSSSGAGSSSGSGGSAPPPAPSKSKPMPEFDP